MGFGECRQIEKVCGDYRVSFFGGELWWCVVILVG